MESVLVVTREKQAFDVIRAALDSDYAVRMASTRNDALNKLRETPYAFLFMDTNVLDETEPHGEPQAALQLLWSLAPNTEIIVMAAKESIRRAVRAVKAGAVD